MFFALQATGEDSSKYIFDRINEIVDDWLLSMTETVIDEQGNETIFPVWSEDWEKYVQD